MKVAATPQQLDVQWLTQILQQAGTIAPSQALDTIDYHRVGNGLMSDSFRFNLRYKGDALGCPQSIIGKFPATNPTSRATGTQSGVYVGEIGFYKHLAGTIKTRVPRTYYAELDPATVDFTLLMEDQSPGRSVDQIGGCSIQDCATALREVTGLHGPHWGNASLPQTSAWMQPRIAFDDTVIAMLPTIGSAFLERYSQTLEPAYIESVQKFIKVYPRVLKDGRSPRTAIHGDFRLDNMIFDAKGAVGTATILDWGTASFASGLNDVSFFIAASLTQEQRRTSEEELLRGYYDELMRYDINYSWDECRTDYRRFSFHGIFTAVFAPMMVERTERSDILFMQMVRKYSDQLRDLDSFKLWE